MKPIEKIIHTKKQTTELAGEIAGRLEIGDVVALYGDLGVGKTFFTKKLCKQMNVKQIVTSPSYVIMNEYNGEYPIRHIDLYRLESVEEVMELGIPEIFEDSITIIEWPELAEDLLPKTTYKIWFELWDGKRKVKIVKKEGDI